MADDTVDAARHALSKAIALKVLGLRDTRDMEAALGEIIPLLDALIAAVRAEKGVERFVDGIIAAVVPKTLDDAGLTDAEVDAFLAAVDETDPERVERIRKLFQQKLHLSQEWVTKVTNAPDDEMRPEYDFTGAVRGKHYAEYSAAAEQRVAEQHYWQRALGLVADELERLTPEQLDARRAKLIAIIRVAAHRFTE